MSDEEDYDSAEDEDYVPSDGEALSEEEHSGEEENLDALKEDGETIKTGKRKRKTSPKKQIGPRKRTGGIKLDDDDTATVEETSDANTELAKQIQLEQEMKKKEAEKKKADDLWSSFMSDVGKRPEKKEVKSSGLGSLTSAINKPSPTRPPATKDVTDKVTKPETSSLAPSKSTITVTKVYDFAGESVQVTKEIDINSKEGKAELKKQQEDQESDEKTQPAVSAPSGVKRPGGGLGGVLAKINKKPKMGTLVMLLISIIFLAYLSM
ncbi:Craniofacial development protein 1 [Mactra antiquata]